MVTYFCYYLGFLIDISHIYRMAYPKKAESVRESPIEAINVHNNQHNPDLQVIFVRDCVFGNGFSPFCGQRIWV